MMTTRLATLSAALLSTLVLTSCFLGRSSVNEPIQVGAVRSLVPGKSTAKECVELLGGPSEVIQLGKRTAYRYDHTISKTAGLWLGLVNFDNTDTRQDRVWLFFDEDSVLSHVGSTFSAHRPRYAMPWQNLHGTSDQRDTDSGPDEGPR